MRAHPYHSALKHTPIPKMIARDYYRCQDRFAQLVIYKYLLNIGYTQEEANEAANSVKGSVSERRAALKV